MDEEMTARWPSAALAVCFAGLGCTEEVVLWSSAASAGTAGMPPVSSQEYCDGFGSPVPHDLWGPRAAEASCLHPASQLFRRALCTCTDALLGGALIVDALDSERGLGTETGLGAELGVNTQWLSSGPVAVRGGLSVAGSNALPISIAPFSLEGSLHTGGDLVISAAAARIGRELWVRGEILAVVADATIEGDVYQPPGRAGPTGVTIGGKTHRQDFDVDPPCACGDRGPDLHTAISWGRARAADDDLGVPADALYETATRGRLELPCGRIAFAGGSMLQSPLVSVNGRSAVYIDGDLTILASFVPDFGSEGELDLFVSGNLSIAAGVHVGSVDKPGALRIYVAGDGDLFVVQPSRLAAGLFAPGASLFTGGLVEVYGALFVEAAYTGGDLHVHYDRALLRPRRTGPGEACVETTAANCKSDGDCPVPFVCQAQRCSPRLL